MLGRFLFLFLLLLHAALHQETAPKEPNKEVPSAPTTAAPKPAGGKSDEKVTTPAVTPSGDATEKVNNKETTSMPTTPKKKGPGTKPRKPAPTPTPGSTAPKVQVNDTVLGDQQRFSCLTTKFRRISAECARPMQTICYYTRRMPRYESDFRPDDLLGRGCDIPRNKEPESCQTYRRGMDVFMRCECATSECNTHVWHGFKTAAAHHRHLLQRREAAAAAATGSEESYWLRTWNYSMNARYMDWFTDCLLLYMLMQVFYTGEFLVKWYKFQRRSVRVRAVLVARGTQQAEFVQYGTEKPEVTIHNFKTSLAKLIDGFIRYRSLGSLPPIDIAQMRATWLLGRQELHRHPEWTVKKSQKPEDMQANMEKKAAKMAADVIDVARTGIEAYFVEQSIAIAMEKVKADKKEGKTKKVVKSNVAEPTAAELVKTDDNSADRSERRDLRPADQHMFDRSNFMI